MLAHLLTETDTLVDSSINVFEAKFPNKFSVTQSSVLLHQMQCVIRSDNM